MKEKEYHWETKINQSFKQENDEIEISLFVRKDRVKFPSINEFTEYLWEENESFFEEHSPMILITEDAPYVQVLQLKL